MSTASLTQQSMNTTTSNTATTTPDSHNKSDTNDSLKQEIQGSEISSCLPSPFPVLTK